jgi:hypothetical protein
MKNEAFQKLEQENIAFQQVDTFTAGLRGKVKRFFQ